MGSRRWNGRTVRIALSDSLSRQSAAIKFGSDARLAALAAAQSWSAVSGVEFRLVSSSIESISEAGTKGDGVSLITAAATPANLALFPKQAKSPPAFTRLFFDRRGTIVEADIVLNPFLQFSADGTPGTYDLQSLFTHELGHALGLGHSPVMAASMYERVSPNVDGSGAGSVVRTLTASDAAAARALYGPRDAAETCCVTVFGVTNIREPIASVAWVEEPGSGRLVGAAATVGGRFELSGLFPGTLRILSQPVDPKFGGALVIAEKDLELPEELNFQPFSGRGNLDLKFLGLGGELGGLPLVLSPGRSYQIFVGGSGLDPYSTVLTFGTGYIRISEGSVFPLAYPGNVSAVAMSVQVDANALPGDYSIIAESGGSRRYLLGAVSVE